MTDDTHCCAELKLIEGARCSRAGSVKRKGEWFCSFHDPGPKMRRRLTLAERFAHVEITDDDE